MPVLTYRSTDVYPDTGLTNIANARIYHREIEQAIDVAAAGETVKGTWADLSAIVGTREGQVGRVTGPDAGTHTDPVVGGTVANEGIYAWSTSPAGWQWLEDLPDVGSEVATAISGSSAKSVPVDADLFGILDSAASFALKKLTWGNLKATLKLYFDTIYPGDTLARRDPFPDTAVKPILWYQAVKDQALPSFMDFTCASLATYFGPDGELEESGIGSPRINHTLGKGETPGLRIEPGTTNIVVDKRDLTQSSWTKTDCTAAKNVRGIDGLGSAASRLTATANNATCIQSIVSSSAKRFSSVFLKRVTGSGRIEMTQDNGATWTEVVVLSTDWKRFTIPPATVVNPQVGFRMATSGDVIGVDFVEMETSAWTAPKSLNDESKDVTTLSFDVPAGFYGTGFLEGTLFMRCRVFPTDSNHTLVMIDDGSNTNRMGVSIASSGSPNMVCVNGGSTVVNATDSGRSLEFGEELVLAMRYKANDWRLKVLGRPAATDSSGDVPSAFTTVRFGRTATNSNAGVLDLIEFALFPRALDDGEMDALVESYPLRQHNDRVIIGNFGGEGNDNFFVRLPDDYRETGAPHPMVICHHGNGWTMNGTEIRANFTDITMFGVDSDNGGTYLDTSRADYLKYSNPVIEALRGAGFVVCGAQNYADNLYGNKNCRNAVVDFYQWMLKNFNVRPRCHMLGASNGAMSMLNACHLLGSDNVASIAAIYPLVSLIDHYVEYSGHRSGIEAAYGLSAGPHDKATLLTFDELYTHCPVNDFVIGSSDSTTQKTRAFPPMIMIASGGDTLVEPAANAELLKALCDRSRLICEYTDIDPGGSSGYGHGHYLHFKEAEILAFFQANK